MAIPTASPSRRNNCHQNQSNNNNNNKMNNKFDNVTVAATSASASAAPRITTAASGVSFCPTVKVRQILSLDDYSTMEKASCWYTAKEFAAIKTQIRLSIMRIENGIQIHENDSRICIRGLESYTSDRIAKRQFLRKQAKEAVFEEQERWYQHREEQQQQQQREQEEKPNNGHKSSSPITRRMMATNITSTTPPQNNNNINSYNDDDLLLLAHNISKIYFAKSCKSCAIARQRGQEDEKWVQRQNQQEQNQQMVKPSSFITKITTTVTTTPLVVISNKNNHKSSAVAPTPLSPQPNRISGVAA